MTKESLGQAPFRAHVELLRLFLASRDRVVAGIEDLLNAQRQPVEYFADRTLLSRQVEDCFFGLPTLTPGQVCLRGQLQRAHWDSGFKPRDMPGLHNDLVDPGEMMRRAFQQWQQTRWPGRSGRARYAQTLFNLYLIRSLEHLVMRVWDGDAGGAGGRLRQVQQVLDSLLRTSPADQPRLVRDARWLIPLAQSPTTDELAPYFEVADRMAESLPEEDRIEIAKASVQMAGGHLRSQLRHYVMKGMSLAESNVTLVTRRSNALDFAMSVQWLVPLFEAYQRAVQEDDRRSRLELASAICQGISADPELFVNRIDLLGAYSMIEPLFIAQSNGSAVYTPMGRRHVQLLKGYDAWIGRLALPLSQDCPCFRPVQDSYSPYGVIYGFSTNLTEHMAAQALKAGVATPFGVEDVFADGGADKLAWVDGWRKLPHIKPEIQKLYDYPQRFAEYLFDRVERELRHRAATDAVGLKGLTGRLFIVAGTDPEADVQLAGVPELPPQYIQSSDTQYAAEHGIQPGDQAGLLRDRQEGTFLVSYRTCAGWVAVGKDVLTDVLGRGRDVRIGGLPREAAAALVLMFPV